MEENESDMEGGELLDLDEKGNPIRLPKKEKKRNHKNHINHILNIKLH